MAQGDTLLLVDEDSWEDGDICNNMEFWFLFYRAYLSIYLSMLGNPLEIFDKPTENIINSQLDIALG